MRSRGRVTERTFYPYLMDIIRTAGGSGVQEIAYNSIPDIVFSFGNHPWLLSVKIGQDSKIIKDAFLQYLRHKEESKIDWGIVLLMPESIRRTQATEEAVRSAAQSASTNIALIDAGFVKEEIRNYSFPEIISFLEKEVLVRLEKHERRYYSLSFVVSLLQQQVSEMMSAIALDENTILHMLTHPDLLMDLGHLKANQVEAVARFLASFILINQILFLRLLTSAQPNLLSFPVSPISHHKLRRAFTKVLEINYRPIFKIDVLDATSEEFLKDAFDLIWGLEIENVRYELPGRIFHELMPSDMRKMLAAFYTRPQAAHLLACLTISHSNDAVFDPACGSGTILTSAYRQKLELFGIEGKAGNPHKRFCEEEIFGADIMPFAVHLTAANLAAMDVATSIDRAQIIRSDSLELAPREVYKEGVQLDLYPKIPTAQTTKGDAYEVSLDKIGVILMNPPFTKVERGIRHFADMERFSGRCGGEVGLWGHFVAFADVFLTHKGIVGAVIPVNVLRGRESEKVRRILFQEWTPLYILKSTRNYGFSEWSEYRDILFIACKRKPTKNHQVKFCLIKKDLAQLTENDILSIVQQVKKRNQLRSPKVDIDSYPLSEIKTRFANLMWFCGSTDFHHRDAFVAFIDKFSKLFLSFPNGYFAEGYRPVPKGVSKFLFLTRASDESRTRRALLTFRSEGRSSIKAFSPLGSLYEIECTGLTPTLRTPVGLRTMDVSGAWDYIAHQPYTEIKEVCRTAGFRAKKDFKWNDFWKNVHLELSSKKTRLVVSHRINPFSPSTFLVAFFSEEFISPSNQFHIIVESDIKRSQAVCALLNSVFFLVQFFLLKEESTGRYINIRFYDLYEMSLYPSDDMIKALARVFREYSKVQFTSLRNQFDEQFEERYKEVWDQKRSQTGQRRLWSVLREPVQPSSERTDFDLAVCKAVGVPISRDELIQIYEHFVSEMISIRGLKRD